MATFKNSFSSNAVIADLIRNLLIIKHLTKGLRVKPAMTKMIFRCSLVLIMIVFSSVSVFSQREVIAIANGKDTVSIEQFDASNNLVFEKSYTALYVTSHIRAFIYDDNNRKTRFIWLHSNVGFTITDYEYDSLQNSIKEFQYESKGKFGDGATLIPEINSIKDLEEATRFKEAIEQGRYLSIISYFLDTLPTKIIYFDRNGDTRHIVYYSYNDQNLLIIKHDTSSNGYSCKTFYTYDTMGRILSWGKCNIDNPHILYKYDYETPNIIKEYEINNGKKGTTQIEEYEDGKIVKLTSHFVIKRHRRNNRFYFEKCNRVIFYEYDEEKRLVREYNTNSNCNSKPLEIKYIHKRK